MLHNVLGFGGRMGRLEYFLCSIVLAFLLVLVAVALFFGLAPLFAPPGGVRASAASPALVLTVLVLILPVYLWFGLAFQAKRFRDMGWNPVYVLPGWIAAQVIDRMVAFAVPTLALGPGSGTLLGTLLSLAMGGCLLFWPSAPSTVDNWDDYHWGSPDPDSDPGRAREAIRTPRPAATWNPAPAPAPSGFGRRGL